MKKFNLIFIIGEAATGKTTMAEKIAEEFKLPLLSKDALKVILFDELGWKDRAWSREIGNTSYSLMDYIILEQLKAGNSLVIESTFLPQFANPKFQNWQEVYSFNAIQVYCHADSNVVIERFKNRALNNPRHVSHVEGEEGLSDLVKRLESNQSPTLDLKSKIIDVDTTDFNMVNYGAIINQIKEAM